MHLSPRCQPIGFAESPSAGDRGIFTLTLITALILATLHTPSAIEPAWAGDQNAEVGPFEYFRNPWQVVGLKDYAHGTRISPEGRLVFPDGRQVILRFGERWQPVPRQTVATLVEGWLPIVRYELSENVINYTILFWATPLPDVDNWEAAFTWPIAGDGYSTWIRVQAVNTDDKPQTAAVGLAVLTGQRCDWYPQQRVLSPGEETSWSWHVDYRPNGKTALGNARESSAEAQSSSQGEAPQPAPVEHAHLWLVRTRDFWQGLLARASRIEIPCSKATLALRAAHVCQLIASDHGELHAGEGFYDELYIRDAAYQVLHLLEAGFVDEARNTLERFLAHQRDDGRFETQKGQLDANGQALWALWKYVRMTGDVDFLRRVYPQMRRAALWIKEARRQEPEDTPFAGLLPAAVADGEYLWDGKHHIVGYDFWNLRGLLCVAEAARTLGLADEADTWQTEAAAYRKAIDRAWQKTGLPYFPPSWEKAGTHWGNTETLWPTLLFDAFDPRVSALIRHVRTEHGGGYLQGTIRWIGHRPAIHPYMGAYTALAALRRGERQDVVADFFWYLLHSSATHAFPEGIYPELRTAWGNTIPHALGAANYAILLRHMLVDEVDDRLYLLPGVPPGWLAPGCRITVENAPIEFGMVTMKLCGVTEGVTGQITARWRSGGPRKVVITVPRGQWLVQAEGIDPQLLEFVHAPPFTDQWSYSRVVEFYRQSAPPRLPPAIPLLEPLPVVPPPDPARCVMVDLRPCANTDPFTAPFGVPRPGKYLFTGLPTGEITLLGVPFRLIDPQANGGRGLVVLHSQEWPAAAQFPKAVEIPIGKQVRRVFVLGNVAGWAVRDPGAGPDQAIGDYVLVYTDGTEDMVPLVPGRTVDDWAASPQAEEVLPVLRGQPWHLNLLAIRTRDVPLAKIIFRDRGTPAAPVVAAITVEK